MNWFYEKNSSQKGPVSTTELQALLSSAEITEKTMIWREGMGDWMQAGRVTEFAHKPTTPAVSYEDAAPSTAAPSPVGYGPAPTVFPEVAARAEEAASFNTLGLISLIAGLLSLLICSQLVVALVFALVAIVTGHLARKKRNGKGMALTGLITGYLGVVVAILVFASQNYIKNHPEILEKIEQEALKKQQQQQR